MEGKTRKENYIFHYRSIPTWLKRDAITFHLLAEFARRVSRTAIDVEWNEEVIHLEPGQFITGRISTSKTLGITEGLYRGAFKKLKKTGIIQTIQVTNRYTVCLLHPNDAFYVVLGSNSPANQPPNLPTPNQRLTTNDTVDTEDTESNDTQSQLKNEKGKSSPYKQNPHSGNQRQGTGMTHISNALPTNIGKGVNKEWQE